MFVKILGSLCIIISGAMYGMHMSQRPKMRIDELNEIKKAFLLLKSQIGYSYEILPEALINIANRSKEPVNTLFKTIANKLNQKSGKSVSDIWYCEFKAYKNTNLSKEDIYTVSEFGKVLGYLDKKLQMDNIDIVIQYIDRTVDLILKNIEKDSKMYHSLGILGGILIALLLI